MIGLGGLRPICGIGLFVGTLFFAASLTPSLIPRTYAMHGVLAGACFAIGYGFGVLGRWLWTYLELSAPAARMRAVLKSAAIPIGGVIAVWFLWRSVDWQNAVREAVGMEPVDRLHALKVCLIAVATFVLLLLLARAFGVVARRASRLSRSFVPRRLANVIGFAAAGLIFWSIATDVLVSTIFEFLDSSHRELNAFIDPDRSRPMEPFRTGSPSSLVDWIDLGRTGREFVAQAPTAAEISAITERPGAKDPIRVYVGLPSGSSHVDRATLALEELKRAGGFLRSRIIVITPTGTGWVDPAAIEPIEYLSNGDVASVALQYSYLSSPLSLLAEPEYGSEAAQALFRAVYRHWTTLPKENRPRLYLHGLSLGAMNSELSLELIEMLADPIDGAVWSGPPFKSRRWKAITEARNPGSPQWLPVFRDSAFVRFMNQNGPSVPPDRPWGPLRIVYLQYASDPITFFDYRDAYRRPDWMRSPTGPDVSPELRWYPVVTMLQLALDMAFGTTTPMGYGHVFAPEHYVDAWTAVADIDDWSQGALTILKERLGAEARAKSAERGEENRGG